MGFYLGGRDQGAQAWTLEELIPDLVEEQGVRRPEGTLSPGPPGLQVFTGLNQVTKRLSRLVNDIYRKAGGVKQLFKRRRKQ